MRKLITLLLLVALPLLAVADGDPKSPGDKPNGKTGDGAATADVHLDPATGAVSITSRGLDLRDVLYDLFTQGKRNFVLEPNLRQALYLTLAGVEFEEGLQIVCQVANLQYEVQNGIYFIGKKKAGATPPINSVTVVHPKQGPITEKDLQKRLTVRLRLADLRDVFKGFAEQTKVKIEVADKVPHYKMDVFLIDTSLKYALDSVTRAAGLKYRKTDDHSVIIENSTADKSGRGSSGDDE